MCLLSHRICCTCTIGNGTRLTVWQFNSKLSHISALHSFHQLRTAIVHICICVLGEHRPNIWVSDLFSAQKNHPAPQWQVCLAHQLRDCQYAIDALDRIFAPAMKRLLLRAFIIHRRREKIDDARLKRYRENLQERLTGILNLAPHHPNGIRLRKRYGGLIDNLFLFLEDAGIPPTNNSSEQAIRMSVIFRRVTNGFRSPWGRDLFAAVRSVVNTGKRQGLTAYQSIQQALSIDGSLFFPS
ncbi:transposase [Microcoleus sp. AT3-A2]|uniref:IS66 family transposase n=1 Tax=Microcoleus sp. herbarium5 TaxID=3055434 RepID=UPI002FD31949